MSFGTVLVVMLLSGRKLSSFILPGIFFLCGLLFLSVGFVWHITYDKKQIVVRSCFGVRRTFSYADLSAYSGEQKDKALYFHKRFFRRKIRVDGLALGGNEFVQFTRKQYLILNDGRALPVRSDLFRGKLENPGEFLFVFLMLLVVSVVLPVMAVYLWIPSYTQEQLQWEELTVTEACWSEETLQLYAADGACYEISDMEKNIANLQVLLQRLPMKQTLLTGETTADDAPVFAVDVLLETDDSVAVYALTDMESGVTYLTLDQMNAYHLRQNVQYFCLSFLPMAAVVLFSLVFLYVVNHAAQLPKWVVRLFVKDGYIRD